MSTTDRPDLSIVLVNWNSLALTGAALVSIKEKTEGITYEVIVVDNGTTKDDSVVELPGKFPWVIFIANPDNRGFSKASNQGIRISRGRYVLLLNSDTVQIENALGAAVRYMDQHPEVGALGILHLNNDAGRTFQPSFFRFPDPWLDILGLLGLAGYEKSQSSTANPSQEQDVDWICGSFLLIRRKCLDQVGELDERFFVYEEDIDWCLRAKRAGLVVRFWPGAAMVHMGSATQQYIRDKTFMHVRSHLSYIHKHYSLGLAAVFYLAMNLRLAGATMWQVLRLMAGRASPMDVTERLVRHASFLLLRQTESGLGP